MATLENESVYRTDFYGSDDTDDLEKTLVLVAKQADPDARNTDDQTIEFGRTEDQETDEILGTSSRSGDTCLERNYHDDEELPSELQKYQQTDRSNYEQVEVKKNHEQDRIIGNNSSYEDSRSKFKRKYEDEELSSKVQKYKEHQHIDEAIKGHAKVVATHYNAIEEKGLDERSKSRIFYMRNFHNWIKSMLINEYLTKIKDSKRYNEPIRVHDMCCGKGGDLLKWRKGNITHLICSDIASVSLEQCKTRYQDMKNRCHRDRNSSNIYSIEYIAADCSRVRLREKYNDASMKLDLVSCQFAFHYSFESLLQAECMIKNAAECLQPGGYFIGTIPDANALMARVHNSGTNRFGNDVYSVTFQCDTERPPLFGAKYNFHLDGVVDCPEFLVYFPLLVKLAKKYGLKLVKKEKFYDFYMRMKSEGKNLLMNMKSLETYPASQDLELVGNADNDYEHAKAYLETQDRNIRIGTLSKSEWEASSLYMTFVFEKVKNTWNSEGVAVYDI